MPSSVINPSRVSWSGENPGIYLKETAEGPFVALASFFRVVVSPHGVGRAVVVCASPTKAAGAEAGNFVITDNPKLARWLVSDFVASFGAFKGLPALGALEYLNLDTAKTSGDTLTAWTEAVAGGGRLVEMTWKNLGKPHCVDVPPAQSATGKHQMYSLFLHGQSGTIKLDGKNLPGRAFDRPFFGGTGSTAFLAFSETWLDPV